MTDNCIRAIPDSISPSDCRAAIARSEVPLSVIGYRRLYYPYDWYLLRYRANTWLGRTGATLSCLADARTGICATADPFSTQHWAAADNSVLDRCIDRDRTLESAKRYASHAIRQRHKALLLPQIDVLESSTVYKPFWVVDYREDDDKRQSILFDGLTGEYCALTARAEMPDRRRPGSQMQEITPTGRQPHLFMNGRG